MMSQMFKYLSVMAIIGIAAAASPQSTAAGTLPARAGRNDWPTSEPSCWGYNGPTVQNSHCFQGKYWYIPLGNASAGTFWVTVTAEGSGSASNVECRSMGSNREGTVFTDSGYSALSRFGVAVDMNLATTVPLGGTVNVDCYVLPGGKIHTLSW